MVEEERGGGLGYVASAPARPRCHLPGDERRTPARCCTDRRRARCSRTGHLAEAALHFARSAERGDSEAVEVLLDAMRQAERREAYREALELQAELVDLLPADDQRWLEVLEAMYARAEWLIDHRAETDAPVAVKALRAIDGLLEGSSDHARRAIVKFRLATFLAWGMGELEAALPGLPPGARAVRSRCGDERQTLLAARELGLDQGPAGRSRRRWAPMPGRWWRRRTRLGDRFVAMQGLSAISYSANFCGALLRRRGGAAPRRGDRPRRTRRSIA